MHDVLVQQGGVFLEDGKTLSNSVGNASTLDELQPPWTGGSGPLELR
jgi:hypothetical protein